jgi:hypothetical protein
MERNGSIQTPNIRSKTTSAGDSLQKINTWHDSQHNEQEEKSNMG